MRNASRDGKYADQAWRLLKEQTDVGYVIAGKLMLSCDHPSTTVG